MPQQESLQFDHPSRAGSAGLKMSRKPNVATRGAGIIGLGAGIIGVLREELLDLILPPTCKLCLGPLNHLDADGKAKAADRDFCVGCERQLSVSQRAMSLACQRCGIPGSPVIASESENISSEPENTEVQIAGANSQNANSGSIELQNIDSSLGCPRCRDKTFAFDQIVSMWMYRDRVCDAVVAAKFAHRLALANVLGDRLGQSVKERLGESVPDEVAYVPSHLTRQLTRGGNSSQAAAIRVAGVLGIPLFHRLKLRRRIAKQAWLTDQQRLENVSGAFVPRKSYASRGRAPLCGQHILVVDDVMTTGATASEVARVLKQSGAARVSLAVIARAVREL